MSLSLMLLITAAIEADPDGQRLPPESRLVLLYAILAAAGLLVLIFVAAAVVLSRLRHRLTDDGTKPAPTPYTDAWSQVRITQEEIDRYAPSDDENTEPRA